MFLSLPLPIKKTRKMTVCLVTADPSAEVYKVRGGAKGGGGGEGRGGAEGGGRERCEGRGKGRGGEGEREM